jgi:hypothetical protein
LRRREVPPAANNLSHDKHGEQLQLLPLRAHPIDSTPRGGRMTCSGPPSPPLPYCWCRLLQSAIPSTPPAPSPYLRCASI